MGKYLLSFHGGSAGDTPEEQQASMGRWVAWFQEIETSLVDPGDAVGQRAWVGQDGSATWQDGENPVTGYTVIEADSLEDAVEIAKGCPIREDGGNLEVGELLGLMAMTDQMEMAGRAMA